MNTLIVFLSLVSPVQFPIDCTEAPTTQADPNALRPWIEQEPGPEPEQTEVAMGGK